MIEQSGKYNGLTVLGTNRSPILTNVLSSIYYIIIFIISIILEAISRGYRYNEPFNAVIS